MQSGGEDRSLLTGCMCIARPAPHFLWDIWGCGAADDYGDQSLRQALLDAAAGIGGENLAASGGPAHCLCQGLCPESRAGRRGGRGEPGKEEGGRAGSWEEAVIGILGAPASPQRPGSPQGPPPGTGLHIHLQEPSGQGPPGLPATPALCTLVPSASAPTHPPTAPLPPVWRVPDWLCLTRESAV